MKFKKEANFQRYDIMLLEHVEIFKKSRLSGW